jgi:hypothetical protein
MLLAIMAMFFQSGTTDIPTLLTHNSRPTCRHGYGWPSSPPSR